MSTPSTVPTPADRHPFVGIEGGSPWCQQRSEDGNRTCGEKRDKHRPANLVTCPECGEDAHRGEPREDFGFVVVTLCHECGYEDVA